MEMGALVSHAGSEFRVPPPAREDTQRCTVTSVLAAGRLGVVSLLGLGLDLNLRCGVRPCLGTSDLIPYVFPKSY